MRSIMQKEREVCYLCGKPPYWTENGIYNGLEERHVFGGAKNRKNSEKYGLKVYLHGIGCHRQGWESAHQRRATRLKLQREAQLKFEEVYGEGFEKIFGGNYK